jgi:hypothetical protein
MSPAKKKTAKKATKKTAAKAKPTPRKAAPPTAAPKRTTTGHLSMDDPRAADVDHVLLDGQRVEGVIELNEVEGWLVRYPGDVRQPKEVLEARGRKHHVGVVEVVWK